MKVHRVKAAAKDYWRKGLNGKPDEILIEKGTPYYWWKFKNQPRVISKTEPTRDQLRKYPKPEFLEKTEDFQCRIDEQYDLDYDGKEELRSEIEEYKEELEDRLNNIPEALQESSVLNEYIEQLDELIDQIELD